MADCAGAIVRLGAAFVVVPASDSRFTCCPIYLVVACAASSTAGFGLPVVGVGGELGEILCAHAFNIRESGAYRGAVAGGAGTEVADAGAVLRPDNLEIEDGLIEADNTII